MKSGCSLWGELCHHYDNGVRQVRDFQKTWDAVERRIDVECFREVQSKLKVQARDVVWWKDTYLLYFQEFPGMFILYEIERPIHESENLQKMHLPIGNYECPAKGLLSKNK